LPAQCRGACMRGVTWSLSSCQIRLCRTSSAPITPRSASRRRGEQSAAQEECRSRWRTWHAIAALIWLSLVSPPASANDMHAAEFTPVPRARDVALDLPPTVNPRYRARSAAIFDFVRDRLIATGADNRTIAAVLSSVTRNGIADFPEISGAMQPGERTPDLLSQLRWRGAFREIAEATVARFPDARSEDLSDVIQVDRASPDNRFFGRIVSRLQRFFEMMPQGSLALGRGRVRLASLPFRWSAPVRIAPTGSPVLDREISLAVAEIRRLAPEAPLDELSFPAPPGTQNLFFARTGPRERFMVQSLLHECLRFGCSSISDAMTRRIRDERRSEQSLRQFLARAYLTRPHKRDWSGAIALLEVGAGGSIAAAACDSDPGWGEGQRRTFIRSCLVQALGVFPASQIDQQGYSPEFEERILALGIDILTPAGR